MRMPEQKISYDLTQETLEMRVITLEREIERLNDVIVQFIMGGSQ